MRSCPAGACDKIIECECGNKMCWDCGQADHSPALCKMVMDWNIKKNKDMVDSKEKMIVLKNCPNPKGCPTVIEKNDGKQKLNLSLNKIIQSTKNRLSVYDLPYLPLSFLLDL